MSAALLRPLLFQEALAISRRLLLFQETVAAAPLLQIGSFYKHLLTLDVPGEQPRTAAEASCTQRLEKPERSGEASVSDFGSSTRLA